MIRPNVRIWNSLHPSQEGKILLNLAGQLDELLGRLVPGSRNAVEKTIEEKLDKTNYPNELIAFLEEMIQKYQPSKCKQTTTAKKYSFISRQNVVYFLLGVLLLTISINLIVAWNTNFITSTPSQIIVPVPEKEVADDQYSPVFVIAFSLIVLSTIGIFITRAVRNIKSKKQVDREKMPKMKVLAIVLAFLGFLYAMLMAITNKIPEASASGNLIETPEATAIVTQEFKIVEEVIAQEEIFDCQISAKYPNKILRWCNLITKYANKRSLPPDLVAAVILQESGGNPDAFSQSGAVGLMQVMPRDGPASTFMCVNGPCFANRPSQSELRDPEFNIAYGTRMLAGLVRKHGSLREALKAYGPMDRGYSYADRILQIYNRGEQ